MSLVPDYSDGEDSDEEEPALSPYKRGRSDSQGEEEGQLSCNCAHLTCLPPSDAAKSPCHDATDHDLVDDVVDDRTDNLRSGGHDDEIDDETTRFSRQGNNDKVASNHWPCDLRACIVHMLQRLQRNRWVDWDNQPTGSTNQLVVSVALLA